MDKTAAALPWNGVPENPEHDGAHCMEWANGQQFHVFWVASWRGYNGFSRDAWKNWKYLGPAPLPADFSKLRAERDELRKLLVGLGAGIPAAAILKAEDRDDPAQSHAP